MSKSLSSGTFHAPLGKSLYVPTSAKKLIIFLEADEVKADEFRVANRGLKRILELHQSSRGQDRSRALRQIFHL